MSNIPLSAEDQARFIDQYINADVTIEDMKRTWKRPEGTLYRWGYQLGLRRPKPKGQISLALDQVRQYCEKLLDNMTAPTIDIKPPLIKDVGKNMDMILWLTDLHPGRLTASYNEQVFRHRMQVLATRLGWMAHALRQNYYTIYKLHIFALGDFVVGENVGRNITLEELEHTVLTQVFGLAIPECVTLVMRLLPVFEEIEISCVKGNHGDINKWGPSQAANWDTVVYLGWQYGLSGLVQRSVKFNIETIKWYNYARVRNLDWLLVHGDQTSPGGGSPYNAFAAKSERWHRSMPKQFDYIACGHYHQFFKASDVWGGPTMLSDDDWSREVLGKEGECGQLVMGVTDAGIEYIMPIGLRDVKGPAPKE